jgi:hypothetical protein
MAGHTPATVTAKILEKRVVEIDGTILVERTSLTARIVEGQQVGFVLVGVQSGCYQHAHQARTHRDRSAYQRSIHHWLTPSQG